jgi:hypothetical protein
MIGRPNNSGSFAKLAAIRRASSYVSSAKVAAAWVAKLVPEADRDKCPLFPQKRTFAAAIPMSALCHNRTPAPQQIEAYSITSSARASSVGGISIPSARAVLRLTTSSNLVGCSTGRSAGLAPLRILSM